MYNTTYESVRYYNKEGALKDEILEHASSKYEYEDYEEDKEDDNIYICGGVPIYLLKNSIIF